MFRTDALYILVKSLSKSEKRYFKLYCELQEGDKVYVSLYEMMGKEEATAIRHAFIKKYPEALFEPARKHLYKMLMKSLRSYEADKSTENKLMNLVADIRILFRKGLIELCFTQIEKAKKIALRYEKFAYYLIVARMELQYLTECEFPEMDEKTLVDKQEKINDILYHQLFINKHASLYEILLYRYFHSGHTRSQQENEKLNDLLLEEYQVNATKHYSSFESAKLHLHFQSTYFLMTGNYEESLKLYDELKHLFARHRDLWEDAPMDYLYLINGALTGLKSMRKYETMRTFLEDVKQLDTKSENLHTMVTQLVFAHEMSILIDTGQFEQGLSLVKTYESELLKKGGTVSVHTQANVYFYMGVVYFGIADYHQALQYINEVLNIQSKYISQQLYSLCRLLHLLLHFELGNEDFLNYELRSVERKLKAGKKLFQVEKVTIGFFKKWLKGMHKKNLLQEYHRQLLSLSKDPYEMQLLRQFDFITWVEAKLKKAVFAELVREKNVKENVTKQIGIL